MRPSRLYRSRKERLLFGVAGGLSEYFDIDPVLVRLIFVLLTFASGVGLIVYIVLALITPREEAVTPPTGPAQVVKENIQSIPTEVAEAGRRVKEAVSGESRSGEQGEQTEINTAREAKRVRPRNAFAIVLIVVGIMLLLINVGPFPWINWSVFWPVVLIAIGVAILAARMRRY